MEVPEICRLCVAPHDPRNMTQIFCGADSLEAKITSVIHIQVSFGDGLPASVCNICATKLNQAFDFIEQSVAGDHFLRGRQGCVKVKEEVCDLDVAEVKEEVCDLDVKVEILSPCVEIVEQAEPVQEPEIWREKAIKAEPIDYDYFSDERDDVDVGSPAAEPSPPQLYEKAETPGLALPITLESLPCFIDEFQCDSCLAKFPTKEILRGHIIIGTGCKKSPLPHAVPANQPSQRDIQSAGTDDRQLAKKFNCTKCPKKYPSSSALERHMRYHRRLYGCKVCEKRFECSAFLKSHMEIHAENKLFKVRNVSKTSATYDVTRPFHCAICDQFFQNKSSLNQHERTHTGLKPFKCDFCERCYSRNTDKNTHMRKNCHARNKDNVHT